jgi:hypothetical protein
MFNLLKKPAEPLTKQKFAQRLDELISAARRDGVPAHHITEALDLIASNNRIQRAINSSLNAKI